MFTQSKWDIGSVLLSPDGDSDTVCGVRITSLNGKIEEAYLLTNSFVWWSLQELIEVNNENTNKNTE